MRSVIMVAVLCALTLGCATMDEAYQYLPKSPVELSSGKLTVLRTAWMQVDAGLKSPLQGNAPVVTQVVVVVVTNVSANTDVPQPDNTVYNYCDGDLRDDGPEIWQPDFQGMDIRLSANDTANLRRNGIDAQGSWYSLDAGKTQGISLRAAPDGGIIASARDFVSPNGAKYHFCGFLVQYSSGPLVRTNPLTIPKQDCHNTLRIMFATYR